jgi:hypothetical protein
MMKSVLSTMLFNGSELLKGDLVIGPNDGCNGQGVGKVARAFVSLHVRSTAAGWAECVKSLVHSE